MNYQDLMGPLEYSEKLAMPANQYDVVVNNINEAELEKIGRMIGIENLSSGSFTSPTFPVDGVIYGLNMRFMICLACQCARNPSNPIINVWFMIDTGSPYTYITKKTLKSLFAPGNASTYLVDLTIQDQNSVIYCHTSHDHFKEANILGADAILDLGISIEIINRKQFRLIKK